MRLLTRQRAGLLSRLVLLFIGSCLCWMLLPAQARAATGTIADDAQVLDTATIHQYTDQITYTVDIFTTRVFQGSNDDFDASVKGLASNDTKPTGSSCDPTHQVGCELFTFFGTAPTPVATGTADTSYSTSFALRNSDANQSIEIGIDVPARHIAIYTGKSVTIAQDHYDSAIQAFADTMHQTHDNYTQATVAALNALQNATDRFWLSAHAAGPWLLLIALFVGAIIFSIVAQANGWTSSSSGNYNRWRNNDSWNSGGSSSGGSSSGGTSDWGGGGGGGGGASGNF